MSELFRDTVAGFILRTVTAKKFLRYPEEIPGFKIPTPVVEDLVDNKVEKSIDENDAVHKPSQSSTDDEDVERGSSLQQTASHTLRPVETKDGIILVDWYSEGQF